MQLAEFFIDTFFNKCSLHSARDVIVATKVLELLSCLSQVPLWLLSIDFSLRKKLVELVDLVSLRFQLILFCNDVFA